MRLPLLFFLLLTSHFVLGQALYDNGSSVGIGATPPLSPSSKLYVYSTATIGGTLNTPNAGIQVTDGSNSLIMDPNELYSTNKLHMGAPQGFSFRITDSGSFTERMQINPDGSIKMLNGDNYFRYNGYSDISMRSSTRGDGGRVIVHDDNDQLYLNYGGDFSGGTKVGPVTYFTNLTTGNSYINSKVAIGSTSAGEYQLSVAGKIRATEVKVYTGWADFVFQDDYMLRPLAEVEEFIQQNGHLPDVPSAAEVEKEGVNLGETDALLLQKIEELTLYILDQNKKMEEMTNSLIKQQKEIDQLKALQQIK